MKPSDATSEAPAKSELRVASEVAQHLAGEVWRSLDAEAQRELLALSQYAVPVRVSLRAALSEAGLVQLNGHHLLPWGAMVAEVGGAR